MPSDNHIKLWNECLSIIKDNVSYEQFNAWFSNIEPVSYHNNEFLIRVPSQYFIQILEDRYSSLLRRTLDRVIGESTKLNYQYLMDESSPKRTTTSYPGRSTAPQMPKMSAIIPQNVQEAPVSVRTVQEVNTNLKISYSFINFMEGEENKMARVAGMSISENPGKGIFNPLFLYGDPGVGKTHLVNAVGLMTKERHPEKKVLYVSAHLFAQQFKQATLDNKQNDFVNFYQQIDVLIIDDIQYLATQTKTQDILFHIFNYLHQSGKQLVMTSDREAALLEGFEERMLQRFRWGLSAKIERPGVELRKKILENKITNDGLRIPQNVINYIAQNVEGARDLEGTISALLLRSIVNNNQDIDLELAKEVVGKSVNLTAKAITVESIRDAVCDYFKLSVEAVMSKERKRELVLARQIAMYLAKQHTQQSLSNIGLHIGRRDHATVLHACKIVSEQLELDKKLRATIADIELKIR